METLFERVHGDLYFIFEIFPSLNKTMKPQQYYKTKEYRHIVAFLCSLYFVSEER